MNDNDAIAAQYDRIAEAYHVKRMNLVDSQWNHYLESPAMTRMLQPLCPGRHALDLGCGTGILTAKLLEWGVQSLVGVDPSENMLAIARQSLKQIHFHRGCGDALPFDDRSFDLVASSLVLHYMRDLRRLFAEVSRVLMVGSFFVFSMHHPFEEILIKDSSDESRIWARTYFSNEPYYWPMCGESMTSYHHTLGDIVNGLADAGFVVAGIDECRPDPSVAEDFGAYAYTSRYPPFCVFKAMLL